MVAAGQGALRGHAVGRGYEQFVCPEIVFSATADGNIQALEDGFIKPPRGGEVSHYQLNVIYQATSVQLLCFHSLVLH
jgi:hypothetical protein